MKKLLTATVALLMLSLFGCGGGGGGGTAATGPTAAVVRVSTAPSTTIGVVPAPAGTTLVGVGVTVNLPAGVSVPTDGSGNVAVGAVTLSGVAAGHAAVVSTYDAANRQLTVAVAATDPGGAGFAMGEFVTVNCAIAAGNLPVPANFTISNFSPSTDLVHTGEVATGVMGTYAVTIQ